MKKLFKQTILALATITCLSLMPSLFTQNVNAIGAGATLGAVVGSGLNFGGSEELQNGIGSGRESQKRMSGGASAAKTGFFVTVSIADSDTSTPHAVGDGVVFKTQGGADVPAQFRSSCASQSRIPGASYGAYGTAPWSWPAFRLEGAAGYGGTTKSWLAAKHSSGVTNAEWIAERKCNVPASELQGYINAGKTVFVNVEPIMWANRFVGNVKQASLVGGLTYGVGSTYPEGAGKNFIGVVTHGAFPASFRYEKAWQAIAPCPDPGGRYTSATMTNKSIGCGIISVKCNDSLQVVICCENEDGSWTTEYLGSGPDYTILNKEQKNWWC